MIATIKRALGSSLELLESRLQGLSLEVQDEKLRLIRVICWGATTLFCGMMGVLVISGTLLLTSNETTRIYLAIGLTALFCGLAVFSLVFITQQLRNSPLMFRDSIQELRKDRIYLLQQGEPEDQENPSPRWREERMNLD